MPVFFQHPVSETTRLGIWKIEETEDFFKDNVPQHREVTHPHKRLQHLAGRFLLRFLFPDFPYELIQIADTRKPYLPGEQYHFSISHCGDFAAAIVSRDKRVGVDIEIPVERILGIRDKFLSHVEQEVFAVRDIAAGVLAKAGSRSESGQEWGTAGQENSNYQLVTLLWSAKEAVFKWHGAGRIDFRQHIQLKKNDESNNTIHCFFAKTNQDIQVSYRDLGQVMLAWTIS